MMEDHDRDQIRLLTEAMLELLDIVREMVPDEPGQMASQRLTDLRTSLEQMANERYQREPWGGFE